MKEEFTPNANCNGRYFHLNQDGQYCCWACGEQATQFWKYLEDCGATCSNDGCDFGKEVATSESISSITEEEFRVIEIMRA